MITSVSGDTKECSVTGRPKLKSRPHGMNYCGYDLPHFHARVDPRGNDAHVECRGAVAVIEPFTVAVVAKLGVSRLKPSLFSGMSSPRKRSAHSKLSIKSLWGKRNLR